MYKDATGVTGPTGGTPIPPPPTTPPPEGYEYRLVTNPQTGEKVWQIVAAAVIGAVGSYLSARQANKPRTNETDQTTRQDPYRSDLYQSDIEAILNYQRDLINQGPHYVGNQRFWPTATSPQPGRAPGPMERTDQRQARTAAELAAWRAAGGARGESQVPGIGGGGGGIGRGAGGGSDPEFGAASPANSPSPPVTIPFDKAGAGAPGSLDGVERSRRFGGWTPEELEQDPERISRLGEPGARKYLRYQRSQGDEDQGLTLARLRAIFAGGR